MNVFCWGGNDSGCAATNTIHLYSVQRVPAALSVGKSKEREILHALTFSAEVRNAWSPPYTTAVSPHKCAGHLRIFFNSSFSFPKIPGLKYRTRFVSIYQLNAQFLYSITIYKLHYNPQHVSSSTLLIFRRTNCIITAPGIVTLYTAVHYAGWERTAVRSQPAYCTVEWRYQRL